MADLKVKVQQTPFHTTEKVTVYAPDWKDGKPGKGVNHAPGEATEIHPHQLPKFKKFGYTEEKPDIKHISAPEIGGNGLVEINQGAAAGKAGPGTMTTKGVQ